MNETHVFVCEGIILIGAIRYGMDEEFVMGWIGSMNELVYIFVEGDEVGVFVSHGL